MGGGRGFMALALRALSRDVTLKIHFFLDQCLPPFVRDSRWFMYIPFRLFYGDKAHIFLDFKEKAAGFGDVDFLKTYRAVQSVGPHRETDLTAGCLDAILASLRGQTVLEVGCGRGALAAKMSATRQVAAVDLVVDPELRAQHRRVGFVAANIVRLPFPDQSFDTVVCTHTLEHIQDIHGAIGELRRVARGRLVIVVPKQRPYRYTFDLHLHFFPHEVFLLTLMNPRSRPHQCKTIGADLFYMEDVLDAVGAEARGANSRPVLEKARASIGAAT
jgi:SAM-dependent methyltransferase